jgi:hypothetical protein
MTLIGSERQNLTGDRVNDFAIESKVNGALVDRIQPHPDERVRVP